jgi:HSP20 family protein
MARSMIPWTSRLPAGFESLRREMNDLMTQFFGAEDGGTLTWFSPRTNVAETDNAYEVSVDLPGMKPEDFAVELKEGQLWITGHRKEEKEETGKAYHLVERQYGEFRRVIPLDTSVDPDKVQAEYKDGVLHLTVPKSEAQKPKRIEIKT